MEFDGSRNNGQLAFTTNCKFDPAIGAIVAGPLTSKRIAGRKLMMISGGSFFTGATGGALDFFTLAARRSSEMFIVADGFRNVFISCSICAVVAGSSEGKLMLVT